MDAVKRYISIEEQHRRDTTSFEKNGLTSAGQNSKSYCTVRDLDSSV
jgi:hypothetical protein